MDIHLGATEAHTEGTLFDTEFDDASEAMEVQLDKMFPTSVWSFDGSNKVNEFQKEKLVKLIRPWVVAYISVAESLGRAQQLNTKYDVEFNKALRAKSGIGFSDNVNLAQAFSQARINTTEVSEAISNPKVYFIKYPDEKLDMGDKILRETKSFGNKILWIAMLGVLGYAVIMSSPKLLIGLKKASKK